MESGNPRLLHLRIASQTTAVKQAQSKRAAQRRARLSRFAKVTAGLAALLARR